MKKALFLLICATYGCFLIRFEFLSAMLVDQGLVKAEDIDSIMQRFHDLDVDKDGTIDVSEAKHAEKKETEIEIQRAESKLGLEKSQ